MSLRRGLIQFSRVLILFYITLLALFALDTFNETGYWYELGAGFIIHLIPALTLILILALSWKRPTAGGWLFFIMAIIFTAFFGTYEDPVVFFLISAPLFIASITFLLGAHMKPEKKKHTRKRRAPQQEAPKTTTRRIVKGPAKKKTTKKAVKKVTKKKATKKTSTKKRKK